MKLVLAKKLKYAEFPLNKHICPPTGCLFDENDIRVHVPSLSELIEACGSDFGGLLPSEGHPMGDWVAITLEEKHSLGAEGLERLKRIFEGLCGKIQYKVEETPEEAVASLWLAINKNIALKNKHECSDPLCNGTKYLELNGRTVCEQEEHEHNVFNSYQHNK